MQYVQFVELFFIFNGKVYATDIFSVTKKKQEQIEGEASRLFQALVQERIQQPTLPRSIRVMERERKGGREKGREKVGRGRSDRPCGWPHLFDRSKRRGGASERDCVIIHR